MYIDQTRFDAFWSNPEKYRLAYEVNLVPKRKADGLQRGLAFHLILEGKEKGWTVEKINDAIREEGIEDTFQRKAWALWPSAEYDMLTDGARTLEVEKEFLYDIPGSKHGMVGRVDKIIQRDDKVIIPREYKTAYYKASYDRIVEDWKTKRQADFLLVGLAALGYPQGNEVDVRVVVEKSPAVVWTIPVTRTDFQLLSTQLAVVQTAIQIEALRKEFGIHQPWVHLPHWTCKNCEYDSICGTTSPSWSNEALKEFTERKEHLMILTEINNVERKRAA